MIRLGYRIVEQGISMDEAPCYEYRGAIEFGRLSDIDMSNWSVEVGFNSNTYLNRTQPLDSKRGNINRANLICSDRDV